MQCNIMLDMGSAQYARAAHMDGERNKNKTDRCLPIDKTFRTRS